jgi:hypothetical protein
LNAAYERNRCAREILRGREARDRKPSLAELKENTSKRKVLARENYAQEKMASTSKGKILTEKEMLGEGRSPEIDLG